MSMKLGPSKEAAKIAAREKQTGEKAEPAEEEAAMPAHPQAVPTTPEDLAEAEASAKLDVKNKADADAKAAKEAETRWRQRRSPRSSPPDSGGFPPPRPKMPRPKKK